MEFHARQQNPNTYKPPKGAMCLYGLHSLTDPTIRYIGITTNPRNRMNLHRRTNANPRVFQWLRGIGTINLVLTVLAVVDSSDAKTFESALIKQAETWPLLNRERTKKDIC